jgi:hypothetical protein
MLMDVLGIVGISLVYTQKVTKLNKKKVNTMKNEKMQLVLRAKIRDNDTHCFFQQNLKTLPKRH